MTEFNNSQKNITVEGIEEENKKVVKQQSSTFNKKNYLNDKLENDQLSKELKIRLLTVDKDSNSPFKHIHMHTVRVPKEISPSGWKSYVCLEHTEGPFSEELGHKCPFCEYNREMYKKSTEATNEVDKKRYQDISLANKANPVSIARCIERGKEEDGPKFWKFNVRKDGKDPEGVIKSLYRTRKQESIDQEMEDNNGVLPEGFIPMNILDIDNGKDLKITISAVLDDEGKKTSKKSIDIMDYGKNKPLSNDPEIREKLINDEKMWYDVFVAKPYDYLKIILEGGIPWFDKANNKWVPKDDVVSANKDNEKEEEAEVKKREEVASKQSTTIEVDDDELPY